MGKESTLILHAGYIGFYMLFVYDLFRIFRGIVRHKGWIVALEDYFYCAYFFVTVFLFLNREGNGTLRWFAVSPGWNDPVQKTAGQKIGRFWNICADACENIYSKTGRTAHKNNSEDNTQYLPPDKKGSEQKVDDSPKNT